MNGKLIQAKREIILTSWIALSLALYLVFSIEANAQVSDVCPNYISNLQVGSRVKVSPGQSNNLRAISDTTGTILGQLPAGREVEIIAGPRCRDGLTWWRVDDNGLVGWTAEGHGDNHWLDPVNESINTLRGDSSTSPIIAVPDDILRGLTISLGGGGWPATERCNAVLDRNPNISDEVFVVMGDTVIPDTSEIVRSINSPVICIPPNLGITGEQVRLESSSGSVRVDVHDWYWEPDNGWAVGFEGQRGLWTITVGSRVIRVDTGYKDRETPEEYFNFGTFDRREVNGSTAITGFDPEERVIVIEGTWTDTTPATLLTDSDHVTVTLQQADRSGSLMRSYLWFQDPAFAFIGENRNIYLVTLYPSFDFGTLEVDARPILYEVLWNGKSVQALQPYTCPNTLPVRLSRNGDIYSVRDVSQPVYLDADFESYIIGYLDIFDTPLSPRFGDLSINGVTCNDSGTWWHVRSDAKGSEWSGYLAETRGQEYLLKP